MHILLIPALLLGLAQGPFAPAAEPLAGAAPLDVGYREMYNLQFNDAHRTFDEWGRQHPEDPLTYTSDGAAYLFDQFDRLGVLQSQLFTDDEKFLNRVSAQPDPAVKKNFEAALAHSDRLADAALRRNPGDHNALFAKVLNLGLRSDYAAMIERRNIVALSETKQAGELAERLLAADPGCYDAYLAVGVENYMLGLKPAPMRWMLRLYGAETDKSTGIEKLQLTATHGHYLMPFAQLLLAVAALRDHQPDKARQILAGLAREFPNNNLYRRELARIR